MSAASSVVQGVLRRGDLAGESGYARVFFFFLCPVLASTVARPHSASPSRRRRFLALPRPPAPASPRRRPRRRVQEREGENNPRRERWPGRSPSPATMIKAILIFNNNGKPRLSKFYEYHVRAPLPLAPALRLLENRSLLPSLALLSSVFSAFASPPSLPLSVFPSRVHRTLSRRRRSPLSTHCRRFSARMLCRCSPKGLFLPLFRASLSQSFVPLPFPLLFPFLSLSLYAILYRSLSLSLYLSPSLPPLHLATAAG